MSGINVAADVEGYGLAPRALDALRMDDKDPALTLHATRHRRGDDRDIDEEASAMLAQVDAKNRAQRPIECRGKGRPVHEITRMADQQCRVRFDGGKGHVIVFT